LEEIDIDDVAIGGAKSKKNTEVENKKKPKVANTASQTRDGKEQEK